MDLHSLLTISEAVTLAAIERKESRGAQFRNDHPEKSAEYGSFNLVLSRGGDGRMRVRREPIPPMPGELRQIVEACAKHGLVFGLVGVSVKAAGTRLPYEFRYWSAEDHEEIIAWAPLPCPKELLQS